MKWFIIIVVVVIALAVLATLNWIRLARQGPHTETSKRPHRLDDSLTVTDPADPTQAPGSADAAPSPGTRTDA